MKKTCIILSAILAILLFTSCANTSKEEISHVYDTNNLSMASSKEDNIMPKEATEETMIEEMEPIEKDITEQLPDEHLTDPENETVQEEIEPINQYSEKKLIATSSTSFNPNQTNRSSNIRLASSYISGMVLQPNDEFSFNGVVGKRTAEKGFLPADIFIGNSVAQGYGGGICQVSSTVCIAVKQTAMKILEQNPHSQRVSYTTIENEAMISYGTSDFRFVNTYEVPVMLEILFEASEDRETIKCNIYGLE